MKTKSILTALLLGFLSQISAQNESKKITAKLTEATVFLAGAELTHTATATLAKGDNELKIEKLSPTIDPNSLKIKASNGVVVSAFEFSKEAQSLRTPNKGRLKELKDSLELINNQLDKLKSEIKIDGELTNLMKKGVDKNISDTIKIADLIKAMEYYQTKSTEIETRQLANKNKQRKLETLINELNHRMTEEKLEFFGSSGTLRIRCTAPLLAAPATFTLSYFTTAARWTPYYDINVLTSDKPIKITSKAKVSQTTTVDWNNVRLTLSTATPSNGKVAPLFSTWFLQYVYRPVVRERYAAQNAYSYNNEVSNMDVAEALQGKMAGLEVSSDDNIRIRLRGGGSISQSTEPLYIVDGEAVDDINNIPAGMIKNIEVLKDESATAIYGARGANGVILVTTKGITDYVISEETLVSQTFNIELPYSIPGDGKEQSIELKTQEIAAEYKYYCAPKLDLAVYLLAEIAGWEKLNLLSGKANIIYDGTYVGETSINATSTQEKLALTLGADKRVTVKRELLKDYSSTKLLGSDVKQVFAYKLTVKNNQNKPIKMTLKEQYPKSTTKEIEALWLKDETTKPTAHKEDTGVITWEEDFKAGETKEYKFAYSIKYPKGKEVK